MLTLYKITLYWRTMALPKKTSTKTPLQTLFVEHWNTWVHSCSCCASNSQPAPEMILGKGYGKAADWWSIGILLYDMLVGKVWSLNKWIASTQCDTKVLSLLLCIRTGQLSRKKFWVRRLSTQPGSRLRQNLSFERYACAEMGNPSEPDSSCCSCWIEPRNIAWQTFLI